MTKSLQYIDIKPKQVFKILSDRLCFVFSNNSSNVKKSYPYPDDEIVRMYGESFELKDYRMIQDVDLDNKIRIDIGNLCRDEDDIAMEQVIRENKLETAINILKQQQVKSPSTSLLGKREFMEEN